MVKKIISIKIYRGAKPPEATLAKRWHIDVRYNDEDGNLKRKKIYGSINREKSIIQRDLSAERLSAEIGKTKKFPIPQNFTENIIR